jgi:drug/metabolite transporter (DMT)-like permease
MLTERTRALPILLICGGVFLLAVNAATAKWLIDRYSPLQILFGRSVLALPFVALLAFGFGGRKVIFSKRPSIHVLRGVLTAGAIIAFVESIDQLPLAEATALLFTAPVFVTIFSVLVFKEKLNRPRIMGICGGFIGGMVIIHPSTISYEPATLIGFCTALLNAGVLLSSRWIDKRDSFWTLIFYMGLFPPLLSFYAIFTEWPVPQPIDVWLFLCTAICGTLAPAFATQAFRMAPASSIAPFDYTALIWAALMGWIFWGEHLKLWTCVGAAIIIAGSLQIILAEKSENTP